MTKKRERILEQLFYMICLLVTAIFVYSRGQDINWDLQNYHFYQGYALINGRFYSDIAVAGLQSFLNPIINVFSYLLLVYLPFPLSAWTILLIQLTSIPIIVLIAKEINAQLGYTKKFITTIPAVILSLQAPLWGSELGTTFFSSWTAPLILWSVYFVLSIYQSLKISILRIVIAGFLLGLAAGLKLTNAPFAVSGFLMMAILLHQSGWRTLILGSSYFILAGSIGFAFTAWWNWYLWSVWGSPVFPFYNTIFKSEFFDFVKIRDMRWSFSSFQEFLMFIVQSAHGTDKTSEVLFADARYLFLTMLIIPVTFLKSAVRINQCLMAFIAFMVSSFVLWILMFAYQRYLIPVELLLGVLIWIAIVRIANHDVWRNMIMIILIVLTGALIKIPDWGHSPMALGGKNPFSIDMDVNLSTTPARYILVGAPISYVLPSLHPSSVFYGVGLSKQIDDLVFKKLTKPSVLPLRILAKDDNTSLMLDNLKKAGFDPLGNSLVCTYFRTTIGRYIVCEVRYQRQ